MLIYGVCLEGLGSGWGFHQDSSSVFILGAGSGMGVVCLEVNISCMITDLQCSKRACLEYKINAVKHSQFHYLLVISLIFYIGNKD